MPEEAEPPELLSPADSPESAYAAFHYGADAVYAESFTLSELDELTGYAHSLEPKRRVYPEMNTLVLGGELGGVIQTLGSLADMGIDALIIQDWGVAFAARRHFPKLRLHASTQMAVHNAAGARTLARMGFARVAVARELTLEEIREIASPDDIEIECLVHGALCYSYGGLCLFSSHVLGRSAGRGHCACPCRRNFCEAGRREGSGGDQSLTPFSMRDLALPDHVGDLRSAGVRSLRIEGLTKGPLYVAAVTDFYRRILNGTLGASDKRALEEDIKTIFGRPWTKLYIEGRENMDVGDAEGAGHRGAPIGAVESIVLSVGEDTPYLRFTTSRRLELHDGLQIELPGLYRPLGFPVEELRLVKKTRRAVRKKVREAAAGSVVEVALPAEYPEIPPGSPVYCSSSQEVKQRYRHARPKPGGFRSRVPIEVAVDVGAEEIAARAEARSPATGELARAEASLPGSFDKAREPEKTEAAARSAFAKLGGTRFTSGRLDLENPENRFVPISVLTELRRRVTSALEGELARHLAGHVEGAKAGLVKLSPLPRPASGFTWSVKIERPGLLARFERSDFDRVEEVVVGVESELAQLGTLASSVGRERVRLGLPVVTRGWEERELKAKIEALLSDGWSKWEASNASAWAYLRADPAAGARDSGDIDLVADWPVYVLNRAAALQVLDMGASRFTLSPEDGFENMRGLLAEFGRRATVIVYQDTPLSVSATRAVPSGSARLISGHAQELVVTSRRGRTVVVNARPFSIADRLGELARAGAVHLRADFAWRDYTADEVLERWREVRNGRAPGGAHAANFERGLESQRLTERTTEVTEKGTNGDVGAPRPL